MSGVFLKSFLLFLIASKATCQEGPRVEIEDGVLLGTWSLSTDGRPYASFRGIPFAKPPVNELRFMDPQPPAPWSGVKNTTVYSSMCLQYNPIVPSIIGDEDCLFLNVYSPNVLSNGSLPVVVFIHGGAFMYGTSAKYSPSHVMDRDLVFVTFNYRLGPLGFLSTGDGVIPGNYGLKDQVLALRWIKTNIKSFGGNPESITLTGNSAGGASVHYHYLSPLARGNARWKLTRKNCIMNALKGQADDNHGGTQVIQRNQLPTGIFVRGISFSGSAFAPWAFATRPADKARKLAILAGCPTDEGMLACLRETPATVVVDAQVKMLAWKVHLISPFTPTVEPAGPNAFICRDPYHATLAGDMERLPFIATLTSEEGLYPAAAYKKDHLLAELESMWEELASNIFQYEDTLPVSRRETVAGIIKNEYFQPSSQPVDNTTFHQLVEALGDRLFATNIGHLAELHAASGQPVHMYRYLYRADMSLSNLLAQNTEDYGVSHADDIQLLLNPNILQNKRPQDLQMKEMLLDIIYSYATTGIPLFGSSVWLPVKPGSRVLNYLEIRSPDRAVMKSSSDFGFRSFWNSLGFRENELYTNIYV